MSTQRFSSSQKATCSNASTSKSAPSSRLSTLRTFLLNSAVTPGGVVVCGLERLAVLDQVGAEQEVVVRPEQVRDPGQEARALGRLEVADRAAEEGDHARAGERDALEVALEVADEAVDDDPVLRGDRLRCLTGDLLGDVDRARRPPGSPRRPSRRGARGSWPPSRSRARSASSGCPRRHRSPGSGARGSRARRASGSTREAGDLLEQLGAALVVEVAWGQLLEGLGEPGPHVRGHPGQRPSGGRWTSTVIRSSATALPSGFMTLPPSTHSAAIRFGATFGSGVLGAAEAGEDLTALGKVPVAKARANHVSPGRPGAASQHLVGRRRRRPPSTRGRGRPESRDTP